MSLSMLELIRHGVATAGAYRLRPPSAALRGRNGAFLGNESGTSLDFHDFRPYQPGDDLRRVDWGVYARSDALVIRQYRIEVSPIIEVLLDDSASMGLYPGKQAAATFLAAFLAGLSRRSGQRPVLVARGRRVSGDAFDPALGAVKFDGGIDPVAVSSSWPGGTGRPLRFVLSDFLYPVESEPFLNTLARDAALLVPVVLLSQAELEPRLSGGVRLIDAETGKSHRDLRIDRRAIDRYQQRLEAHLSALETAARRLHAPLVRIDLPDAQPGLETLRTLIPAALLRQGLVEAG